MFAIRKSQLSLAAATSIGSTSRAASPAFGSGPDRSRSRSKTRLTRGRSLRSLRKYEKVVECLSKPDVNMSESPWTDRVHWMNSDKPFPSRRSTEISMGRPTSRTPTHRLATPPRLSSPQRNIPTHHSRSETGRVHLSCRSHLRLKGEGRLGPADMASNRD